MKHNFKKGDKVICIPGFNSKGSSPQDKTYGGHGYREGKIFHIDRIQKDGKRDILWAEEGGNGIYHDVVKLVEDNYEIY